MNLDVHRQAGIDAARVVATQQDARLLLELAEHLQQCVVAPGLLASSAMQIARPSCTSKPGAIWIP